MSKFFRLDGKDLLKGLVVSILSSVFAALGAMIQNQGFSLSKDNLITVGIIAVTSGLGYLSKQLVTNEEGKLMGKI